MKSKKKNIICYIIVIIVIIILILSIVIVPVNRNNKYKKGILNDIYSNTVLKNISYYNKSNNYYIVKDDKYVYVFDYYGNIRRMI